MHLPYIYGFGSSTDRILCIDRFPAQAKFFDMVDLLLMAIVISCEMHVPKAAKLLCLDLILCDEVFDRMNLAGRSNRKALSQVVHGTGRGFSGKVSGADWFQLFI